MERIDLYNQRSLTIDEMSELFAANNPGFIPTLQAVGRYARKIGFKRATQRQNGKQVYFYVKPQNNGI